MVNGRSTDGNEVDTHYDIDENGNNSKRRYSSTQRHPDKTDLELMDLLLSGHTSRESAKLLNKPVSTIQRRARLLVQKRFLKPTFELGYLKLGIKKGFLHVYLDDNNISDTVDKLLAREGIFSVGVHLGNSDIIGTFVFRNGLQVLDLISWAKHQDGVEKVVWSEEIYSKSTNPRLEKIIGDHNISSSSGKVIAGIDH